MIKSITIEEHVGISESVRLTTRRHDQINFWFLVKYSLSCAKKNEKQKEAFFMNAVVMAVNTVECLLDNLAEHYLTDGNYKIVSEQDGTTDRFKIAIKHLTGQYGKILFDEEFANRELGVRKIEIGTLFSGHLWQDLINLVNLRNKITHRKTQDRICQIDGDERTYRGLDAPSNVDLSKAYDLIVGLEAFFYELKKMFSESIVDYLAPRKESFFSFLEINKNVE